MVGRHLGAVTAVVRSDVFLVRLAVDEIEIKLLAHVHATHRGARNEAHLGQHFRGQLGFFQSLTQGHHAHQRGARGDGFLGNAQALTHLSVGQLHLANGKLLMFRLEVLQRTHARAVGQQSLQSLRLAQANRRNDAHACDQNRLHRIIWCGSFGCNRPSQPPT